jgi:hypothetical protein
MWSVFSHREKPPPDAVAPKVTPLGNNTPITAEEWKYFCRVGMAALDNGGAYVPYVEKTRVEHGVFIPVIRRWNSERLILWQNEGRKKGGVPVRQYYPQGVSASLRSHQLNVWLGKASFRDYASAENRTGRPGAWNAELRGMIRAIEENLPRAVRLELQRR